MKNVACYGRKSVYSDTSDSVEIQIKLCIGYTKSHYENCNILRYEDEGYTGANTSRPSFNRLLEDIKAKRIDVLICYRIDRVSRNVMDFCNFFDVLAKNDIEFVSLKENIDTGTPMGRAMMYMTTVFAQMERETIAERITDNMIELAKSGKWAAGTAPVGYKNKKTDINGKTHTVLEIDTEKEPFYHMIVNTFLHEHTLLNTERYLRNNGVRSVKGNYFSASQIHQILVNPHYVTADENTYNFFKNKGCVIGCDKEKFDGQHGIILYGRAKRGRAKNHINPPEKWIISVGLHKPLISSEKWISIQGKFGQNLAFKKRKYKIGILKGVLRCSCGRTMATRHQEQDGRCYDTYFCTKKEMQGTGYCDRKSVYVNIIDDAIIKILKDISLDVNLIDKYMYSTKKNIEPKRSKAIIQKEMKGMEGKIKNLAVALSDNKNSSASKYIIAEMEKLDKDMISLSFELMEVESLEKAKGQYNIDKESKYLDVCNIVKELDSAGYDEINAMLKSLIKECVYDGSTLNFTL